MAKRFYRPFLIEPPVSLDELGKGDEKYAHDDWRVTDAYGDIISTHKTKERAERALEAAKKNIKHFTL